MSIDIYDSEREGDVVAQLRGLEVDHEPDGWPAVQMRDVTALLDQLEAITRARDAAMEMVGLLQEENAVLTAERDLFKKETVALVKDVRAGAASAGHSETYPAVIFDGYAVYQALSDKAKARTSTENVSDVLDAVADLIRQDLQKR